jgi:hypothetical protein
MAYSQLFKVVTTCQDADPLMQAPVRTPQPVNLKRHPLEEDLYFYLGSAMKESWL